MKKFDTSLYLVTDSGGFSEEKFLRVIRDALSGGVTLLQLREKEKTIREYINLAEKVKHLCAQYNVPLIIDDRIDVALAVDADGVHLGADDMPIATARKILGNEFIIGATAKTVLSATKAYNAGADYIGAGAVFPTTTKVKTVLTPVDTIMDIVKAVPIPVNAIGGLNKSNLNVLKGSGVSGICVVSAIMKSKDPYSEAKELSNEVLTL